MDFSFEFSGALLTGNINPEALEGLGALAGALLGGLAMVWILLMLAIAALMIVSRWRVFRKAGLPGRGIFIPFYNRYLMFKVGGRSGWNFLWILIPPVFGILMIINCFNIAKRFGRHRTYGLGILFLKVVFIPILAFDNSIKYMPKTESARTMASRQAAKVIVKSTKKAVTKAVKKTVKKALAKKAPKKVQVKTLKRK